MTSGVLPTHSEGILYLNRRDVEQASAEIDPVATVAAALALHASGETVLPDEAYLGWTSPTGDSARSLNMPSWLGGEFAIAGTKIINANPGNPGRGRPRASGLTLLFDTATACIVCVMEAAHISSLRTASVSALGVSLLQGPTITCMSVLGAGVLAEAHLGLLPTRLPALRQVQLFDLDAERAAALQTRCAPPLAARDVDLRVAATAEEAVRAAQLVVPVTTTTTGYIPFEWLQPGALLVNVSLDDALPDVALRAGKVIVDDWHLVSTDSRRLLGRLYRQGLISGPDAPAPPGARAIDAELGQVVTGARPGRTDDDEVILLNPFGLSIEDVAVASRVYQSALCLGLGVELEP